MSALVHEVSVRLGAQLVRLGTLDEVQITHDLLAPGSPSTVALWRPTEAGPWPETDLYRIAQMYAPIEVSVDGHLQTRGVVEDVKVGADRGGAALILSCRDLAGAAMVAEASPALTLRDVTLEDALHRLFDPLGISVTVGASADDARNVLAGARPGARAPASRRSRRRHRVDRFRVQPGTKVWQLADQLCRRHGYLLYTAPAGDGVGLVIDRPAYDSEVLYQLTRRRQPDGTSRATILGGWRELDGKNVPTRAVVFGHSAHASREDARHRAEVENDRLTGARFAEVSQSRPWYRRDPRARTPQQATQRARRLLADANASLDVYTCTAQGFGQGRRLFAANAMARVDDDESGARGDWLVTQVAMTRSRARGTTTSLRLVPKNALLIEPDPDA